MRNTLFLLIISVSLRVTAQTNIPIGTWRSHFSYNNVISVIPANDRVFALAENGLFYYDMSDNSIGTISTFDGLQSDDISAIAFDELTNRLLIGYSSGNLDIIDSNELYNFDFISNSQVITSKKINHILVAQGIAFIATDYGLLHFDLLNLQLEEVYRELGAEADLIQVNKSTILNDSIYLATSDGIISSNFQNGTNLFDPNNWQRYRSGSDFEEVTISSIDTFNEEVIAAVDEQGLFVLTKGRWNQLEVLKEQRYRSVHVDDSKMTIVSANTIYQLATDYGAISIPVESANIINDARFIAGALWVADNTQGLITNINGAYEFIKPSGPFSNQVLRFHFSNNRLYMLPGGYDESLQPLDNSDGYSEFQGGLWTNFNVLTGNFPNFNDVTDVAIVNNGQQVYLSSYGKGGLLQMSADGNQTVFDDTNSTMSADTSGNYKITAIAASSEGLWVINYDATQPLSHFNETWNSYSLPNRSILDLVNTTRYLWMIVDPDRGGGIIVFDKEQKQSRYLNTQDGNGGLPSRVVNALAVDQDEQIWVGTDAGVAYFPPIINAIEGTYNAVIPVFENRLLLRDEVITAVEIDPGNRKWLGTTRGVWLFSENVNQQLNFFDTENSPLPTGTISNIEVLDTSGEVFFSTSNGILSYRAGISTPMNDYSNVKIFPNPVSASYNGTIGISGLAFNVRVKITDSSGKLIWDTKSAGGTATWNAKDYNGKRAATGIYFVFCGSEADEETFVGKIAVIN